MGFSRSDQHATAVIGLTLVFGFPFTTTAVPVLPGLFVGNYRDSKDAGQLERHKITHIIAIHDAARRLYSDKEYLCITAADTPQQNLTQFFPTCNDFIHNARIGGGGVLIHCLAGMSRSVTIAVAYIMSVSSLRWNEALKVVRCARAVSNPNSGFQRQLQEFENTKLLDERRRMLEKFQTSEVDEENCRRLLLAYDHLLLSKAICEGKCSSARICPTGTCRAHSSRFSRQRSTTSVNTSASEGSSPSPRGSTKSLDSSGNDPSSPRNWERHYGCWKNHVRSNQPGPSSSSSSTPASPLLYRASTKSPSSRRSDSMLSISSITSLPGQISLEKESSSSPSSSISRSDRNPHLSTQSCPNSPRRMPKSRMQAGSGAVQSQQRGSLGSKTGGVGVSPTDVMRLLEKEENDRNAAILSPGSTSSSTSVYHEHGISQPLPSTSSSSIPPETPASMSRSGENSNNASGGGESNPTAGSSTGTTRGSGGTNNASTSWGTPPTSPCHRFMSHTAHAAAASNVSAPASPSRNTSARNTINMRGITRWVMKRTMERSAYKFNLDKS